MIRCNVFSFLSAARKLCGSSAEALCVGVVLKVLLYLYYKVEVFRAEAVELYFACYTCTTKLRFSSWSCGSVHCVLHLSTKLRVSSWSCGSVLRVLHVYYKVVIFRAIAAEVYFAYYACTTTAIFELELRNCTSRSALVLHSCDFRAGAVEVHFAYYTFTTKLRFSSWSCGSVLGVLRLYYTVTIFELGLWKCTLRTTLLLQSCDFRAGAAEAYLAYYACTTKLRVSSWSCGSALRALHLHYT